MSLSLGRILLVAGVWLMTGCATSLYLSSSPPGVAVYSGGEKIGETPLEVDVAKLKDKQADGYLLKLERADYNKVWFWFPDGMRGLKVNVNLEPFIEQGGRQVSVVTKQPKAIVDQMSARMLAAQTALILGRDVAADDVSKLIADYPDLGASYFLAALVDLKNGQKDEAKAKIAKALKLAPSEPDYVVLYRELGGDPIADLAGATETPAEAPAEQPKKEGGE